MEDALVQQRQKDMKKLVNEVLILVVMEDALVLDDFCAQEDVQGSLNPCCNGRCTRTCLADSAGGILDEVLILVVMEDALVPKAACTAIMKAYLVLILVVMEDALVLQNLGYALFKRIVRLDCASKDLLLTNITYLLSECKITKN